MKLLRNVVAFCCNVFNWKLAIVSAIFQGVIVGWINGDHSIVEYLRAGFSQALMSALSTGVTAGVAQRISEKIDGPMSAYFWGSAIPAAMTFAFSAGVHWLNDTPEFLASCLWPTFVSSTTSLCVNFAARNLVHQPGWRWIEKFILIKPRD